MSGASSMDLLELASGSRVMVVSLDDLGFSLGANEAIYAALRSGVGTSAGLMVPAPWARGAAASYRGEDVGVHLTLNAELDLYRWGPLTHAPSLLDGDGGFPRTVADVWEHADLEEVRREWRAQIERAIYWGFDVSHLGSHLGAVSEKPEFFDAYLDLAEEFQLPIRLPGAEEEGRVGFPFRALAEERRVLGPDRVVSLDGRVQGDGDALATWLDELPAGVTELRVQPAFDTAELRVAAPSTWAERVAAYQFVAEGGLLERGLRDLGIPRIGYRALRALMRSRT